MKVAFLSDLHGSVKALKEALDAIGKLNPDKIVLLGDLMYHGPRNYFPEEYNPEKVSEILNLFKEKIIAVRGNCDSEVDQMLLKFPIMSDFAFLCTETNDFFLTHGHIYSPENHPMLKENSVFCSGHTHVAVCEKKGRYFYFNPGSSSLPKEDNPKSFGFFDGKNLSVRSFRGRILKSVDLY